MPGNHDIWTLDDTISWELHEEVLPRVFQEYCFHPLHIHPFETSGVAFVSSMGWYDYSFRRRRVPLADYQEKRPPWSQSAVWNDARYARFPFDDVHLTALLEKRLGEHVNRSGASV